MEGVDVDAVGDLACGSHHRPPDGGDVHSDVLVSVATGDAHRWEQRQAVVVALVPEGLAPEAGPARPHGPDVVAQPGDRGLELDAVAALDMRPHLAAETEPEAPAGDLGQLPGRLGHDHRAAREGDGD